MKNDSFTPSRSNRIALVGPTFPFRGGIAHHTTLLYEALRKEHDVLFVSFSRQYPKALFPGKSDVEPTKTPLFTSDAEYIIDSMNPFTWVTAARRIARFRPEKLIFPWWVVFWAPQFYIIITLVKLLCKTKIIFLCHNVLEHESRYWKKFATKLVLSRADRLITQSRQETERALEILGRSSPVITGFHPTYAAICKDLPTSVQARKELGVQGKVLLFFGFVRPYKGLEVLLEALPIVLRSHEVTLFVVGEFWKDKKLYFEQIEALGLEEHVRVIDEYVPNNEVGLYFSASDLVVQPYHSATGSGISQLAYGLQKPVIATRVGNLDEVIEDGVNGRLVPPGEANALALAITESLDDEVLAGLTENAATTRERFSWDRLVLLICDSGGSAT